MKIRIDPRLRPVLEVLRCAIPVLRAQESARLIELVPGKLKDDARFLRLAPDMLIYFDIATPVQDGLRARPYLKFVRTPVRGSEIQKRINAMHLILHFRISRFGSEAALPEEREATFQKYVPHVLARYGFPSAWAETIINILAICNLSKEAAMPEPQKPPIQFRQVALEDSAVEIRYVDAPYQREKSLWPSVKTFFEIPRARELLPLIHGMLQEKKYAKLLLPPGVRDAETYLKDVAASEANLDEKTARTIPGEYEECRGWTARSTEGVVALERLSTSSRSFEDLGLQRNPDVVGYRLDEVSALGFADLELLAVEVKDGRKKKGEQVISEGLDKRTIGQAQSYLDFANIVYMAVYDDAESMRNRKILMGTLSKLGIGLLGRKQGSDGKYHWTEVLAARYNFVRGSARSYFIEHFLSDSVDEIRARLGEVRSRGSLVENRAAG
jgi:hypothetical protein